MSMEPNMEVIGTPGAISGTQVIDNLLARIEEKLTRSCDLRSTDVYRGFSATVEIRLQLEDVYPCEVSADIAVGTINPQQPTQRITLAGAVAAEAEPAPGSLERPIDPDGITTEAPARQTRQYVSRIRGRQG